MKVFLPLLLAAILGPVSEHSFGEKGKPVSVSKAQAMAFFTESEQLQKEGSLLIKRRASAIELGTHSRKFAALVTKLDPYGPALAEPIGQCFGMAVMSQHFWMAKMDLARQNDKIRKDAYLSAEKNYTERRDWCVEQASKLKE